MAYYSAGDYYAAGGLSFKKFGKFVKKVGGGPLGAAALQFTAGVVPGGATLLNAAKTVAAAARGGGNAVPNALAQSLPGTPGNTAAAGRRRIARRARSRRRRW